MQKQKKNTKIINLMGSPGASKSTTAAHLFSIMKHKGLDVELVVEYAKELTFQSHHEILKDQFFVSANQNHRVLRLIGKVDYIITDSPIILGCLYTNDYHLQQVILNTFSDQNNVNYLINRVKPYNPNGRNQTSEESFKIQESLLNLLTIEMIPYTQIDGDEFAAVKIFSDLTSSWISAKT